MDTKCTHCKNTLDTILSPDECCVYCVEGRENIGTTLVALVIVGIVIFMILID